MAALTARLSKAAAARRRNVWLAAATAAVLLAGCGASTTATPSTVPNPPATTAAPGGGIDGPSTGQLPTLPGASGQATLPDPSANNRQFITKVFNDIQSTWKAEFARAGLSYTPARLVLFQSAVPTACGTQSSDVGPFYCPADATVYIDLQFFTVLEQQFGVTGDFSQAYVIAHEIGHHLQSQLGITNRVAAAEHTDPAEANTLSVAVELQADCLAGVWAHTTYTRSLLEPGDLDEALTAAAAVGDDFLQQVTGKEVEPENWTHGSSAQRQRWLTTGFDTGSPAACDTFSSLG